MSCIQVSVQLFSAALLILKKYWKYLCFCIFWYTFVEQKDLNKASIKCNNVGVAYDLYGNSLFIKFNYNEQDTVGLCISSTYLYHLLSLLYRIQEENLKYLLYSILVIPG